MRRLPLVSLLVVLLLTACASDGGDEALSSGVRGQVLLGPTCPVVQEGNPCPDEPLGGVEVRALAAGGAIAEATSGEDGRFELELPPGRYMLEAVVDPDGPGMFAKPVAVTVTAGAFVEVVVPVDSGIR
ncbi:MAG TPA: carboxypeptidase-like regulatory domain-containing protein [Actinomycetota bacterium]|nr:carboxypeptidase-like regulatory domain-containing protein [Actinomycetota bacterium]